MNRVGKSLPERLGSVALRYQASLANRFPPQALNWLLSGEAEEDSLLGDGPTARTERMARLEAVLFLAREPMGTRKLADLADLADGTEARTLIRKLNRLYDEEECAFRPVEVAGGFQLVSRPQFAGYLRRLHGPVMEVRLSPPAMETLSVVAYRQPVLRATIESIRGVQCGELLRQLMERDLVRIAGRSEELGRPFLYGTTKRFLQVFGLRHTDELPPIEADLPLDAPRNHGHHELPSPSDKSHLTEEESTVRIEIEGQEIAAPIEELSLPSTLQQAPLAEFDDDSSLRDEQEEEEFEDDEDFDDEDFDDDEEEEEDFDDDDDEGFEDSEWEEVEGDEEESDDDEEEDEEEWEEEDVEEDEEWE